MTTDPKPLASTTVGALHGAQETCQTSAQARSLLDPITRVTINSYSV